MIDYLRSKLNFATQQKKPSKNNPTQIIRNNYSSRNTSLKPAFVRDKKRASSLMAPNGYSLKDITKIASGRPQMLLNFACENSAHKHSRTFVPPKSTSQADGQQKARPIWHEGQKLLATGVLHFQHNCGKLRALFGQAFFGQKFMVPPKTVSANFHE